MNRIDIRDVSCPLTWVRTRLALDRVAIGDRLEVILADGEPLENVPRTAEEEGHQVVSREPRPDLGESTWRVVLQKGGARAAPGLVP